MSKADENRVIIDEALDKLLDNIDDKKSYNDIKKNLIDENKAKQYWDMLSLMPWWGRAGALYLIYTLLSGLYVQAHFLYINTNWQVKLSTLAVLTIVLIVNKLKKYRS